MGTQFCWANNALTSTLDAPNRWLDLAWLFAHFFHEILVNIDCILSQTREWFALKWNQIASEKDRKNKWQISISQCKNHFDILGARVIYQIFPYFFAPIACKHVINFVCNFITWKHNIESLISLDNDLWETINRSLRMQWKLASNKKQCECKYT